MTIGRQTVKPLTWEKAHISSIGKKFQGHIVN